MMTLKTRNNQSGFMLLWSVVIALFLALLLAAAMARSQSQLTLVNHRIAQQRAFYSAEAGIDRSVFELRQNAQWRPGQGGVDPMIRVPLDISGSAIGSYSIEVADGGVLDGWNTLWLKSTGEDDLLQTRRTVVARVLIENPTRFMVSTLGDLRVGSGASIQADVLARDIYFEVNQTLDSPQKDIYADGDLFYTRSINGQNDPAVHVTGNTYKTPSISLAGVDISRYRDLVENKLRPAESVFVDGDLTVDLDNLGDLAPGVLNFQPKLIFATGNVRVSGHYDLSLLIVAGGNIYIDGDVVPDASIDPLPQIGLFADQDVIIPAGAVSAGGNLTLEAFVMADGEGSSAGEFRAEADKFSLGRLDFKGAISILGQGRTGIDLNAFSERVYNYNPDLNRRRAIPFVPFIVNVIRWQEAGPADAFPPAI